MVLARLDPENRPFPKVFKGPTIDKEELVEFRSIKDVVHLGRVAGITQDSIILQDGTLQLACPSDTLVVDCMADFDGQFYGYRDIPENLTCLKKVESTLGQPLSLSTLLIHRLSLPILNAPLLMIQV